MDNTDPLVGDYLIARQALDKAQADLDEVQARLMKQMEADQRKAYKFTTGHAAYTVSYVQAHTTVIDEKGLRRALTAKVFDKYTKKVLDRRSMEKAMDSGEVDPVTVSRFVSQTPNRPHLSLRMREVEE